MMFELDGTPRPDVQSIAAKYIIELFYDHFEFLMNRTNYPNFADLVMILAMACKDNHIVSLHCRHLFSIDVTKTMFDNIGDDYYFALALFHLVLNSYIVQHKSGWVNGEFYFWFLRQITDYLKMA
jgi:hypothetical protein